MKVQKSEAPAAATAGASSYATNDEETKSVDGTLAPSKGEREPRTMRIYAYGLSSASRAWAEAEEHHRGESDEPAPPPKLATRTWKIAHDKCRAVIDRETGWQKLSFADSRVLLAVLARTKGDTGYVEPKIGVRLADELAAAAGMSPAWLIRELGRLGPGEDPSRRRHFVPVEPWHVLRRHLVPRGGSLPNSGRGMPQGGMYIELLFADEKELAEKLRLLHARPAPRTQTMAGITVRRSPAGDHRAVITAPLPLPSVITSSLSVTSSDLSKSEIPSSPFRERARSAPRGAPAGPADARVTTTREGDSSAAPRAAAAPAASGEREVKGEGEHERDRDPARVALEHWREVPFQGETLPKLAAGSPLHTPSRLAIARARLVDGCTLAELVAAVDGAALAPKNRDRDRQSVAAIWGTVDAVQALAAIGRPPEKPTERKTAPPSARSSSEPPPSTEQTRSGAAQALAALSRLAVRSWV